MKRSDDFKIKLNELFTKIYDELLYFIQIKLFPKIKLGECNYIKQTLDILDGLVVHSDHISNTLIEKYFVFSIMWSLGAMLELDDRLVFGWQQ